jgi:2-succinyl-6-hydroxy-2,4-cyclohexadiene-1-carboxylate synthase
MGGTRQLRVISNGDGPGVPLVLVHGFLGSPDDWTEPARRWSAGRPCLRIELPGHGENRPEGRLDFAAAVAAVGAVIAQPGRPVDVIGYSMGGRLALGATLRDAGRVRRLVLISASPGLTTGCEQEARARADDRLAAQLEAGGLPRFVRDWYELPLFESLRARPALLRALEQRRGAGDASALAAALRGLTVGRQPSYWEKLPGLPVPVLWVAGERDPKYRDLLSRAAGLCPHGRLLIVPNAGHMPHLEHPDFCGTQVMEFLAGQTR